jgi:hypothetical protein
VLRVLENAKKEIYFASRYHDPHVSSLTIKKFTSGVRLHIIDGNPKQTSLDTKINANRHEFTIAIANYDNSYLAEKYTAYFHLLKQNAQPPMFIEETAQASSR